MSRISRFLLAVVFTFAVSTAVLLAAGKFEPQNGCYLGVMLNNGGTGTEIIDLNEDTAKGHAVYGKFVVLKTDPFPTNWIETIKTASPGSAAHIVLEPAVGFEDFFADNWGPGQVTYDAAKSFAESCRDAQLPIFLRFAHEANGWWYPWSPTYLSSDLISNTTYITGWRNMANLVHSIATNVAMVWSPNQGTGPMDSDMPYYLRTYPGDDVVDWVGLSIYNGEWYGNNNSVTDREFKCGIEHGFLQEDLYPENDTDVNFYWEFAAPNNPTGHHKPMMIAETSAQFVPQYRIDQSILISSFENLNMPGFTSTKTLAQFQNLNSDGFACSSNVTVDSFTTITDWNWGPWGKLGMASVSGYSGNGARMYTAQALAAGETYVGGNGRNAPYTNWSNLNGVQLYVRRAGGSAPDPLLTIEIRSRTTDGSCIGTANRVVTSTNWYPINIPLTEFTLSAGFTWSNIQALVFALNTTSAGTAPADLYVDEWSRVHLSTALYVDQDWWPIGPQCTPWSDAIEPNTWHTWQLAVDSWKGLTNALKFAGTDAGNGYIGGNGCVLRPEHRNLSAPTHFEVVMRRQDTMDAEPGLVMTLIDTSNRVGTVGLALWTNVYGPDRYGQYVFSKNELVSSNGFDWSQVSSIRFDYLTTTQGVNPDDIYIKLLEMGTCSVNSVELDWWPVGNEMLPWDDVVWTTSTECTEGSRAMKISGTVMNNDWYCGGNGCSLPAVGQNWTRSNCNALVVTVKRGFGADVDPKLKISLDSDFNNTNHTDAVMELRVANSNYTTIVIPYSDFELDPGFTWQRVAMMKFELMTSVGGVNPAPLYVDDLRISSITLTNGNNNSDWKQQWMKQVYSLTNFSDGPAGVADYVSLSESFPGIKMVNWFHIKKFEDGMTKDLRILSDGTNPLYATYNSLVKSNYFLSTVNQPLGGYWTCDDPSWNGTAGEVTDDSGNWNHGKAFNGANTTNDAKKGRAGRFDGTNDYVRVPNSSTLQVRSNLTICFWVKGSNIGSKRVNPIDKEYGGEFSLTIETNRSMNYYHGTARTSGKYFSWTALPSGAITNNAWMHIAITRNAGTRTVQSYVNGIRRGSTTYSTSTNYIPRATTNDVTLASGFTGQYLKGTLDEVRIYNTVLSSNEIRNLFLNP